MPKLTYNKDGSLRRKGSGRPKGATSFAHVKMADLDKFISKDCVIPVSKTWLRKVAIQLIEKVDQE